jgi:hypothetical protein
MRSALFWDITQCIVVIHSGQPIGPIFKGQEVQEGTDWLPRNVGKELPLYAVLSQTNSDLRLLYKQYRRQFAQMQCIQSVHLINYFHLRLSYKRAELYLHFLVCLRGIK